VVYARGGDLTYLQFGLGAILARLIVGVWFVRAFYEREIYSPYDYVGNYLGTPAQRLTTGLFVLGNVLGQSVRVLLTALILNLISGIPLTASIWIIGAFAAAWTLLGGITTVIWTDVIQFFVFLLAMAAGLGFILYDLPGGWGELIRRADEAGKLRFWNLSTDPQQAFTLWAALIGNTCLCLYAYGTDQMMAQRMFCCRGRREAGLAIIFSSFGQIIAVLAALVGLGLFAFYQDKPLSADAAALVARDRDRIFPVFILNQMPSGLVGLIIAGVFAAAISSLDSALAALSQTVVTGFYRPWRERRATKPRSHEATKGPEQPNSDFGTPHPGLRTPHSPPLSGGDDAHYLFVSKLFVVFWAITLSAMAQVSLVAKERYGDILNLALAMATYTGGTLLAAFLLAFWRLNADYRGILWAAPLSVLAVFSITWHQPWAQFAAGGLAVTTVALWLVLERGPRRASSARAGAAQTALVTGAAAIAVFVCCFNYDTPNGWRHLTIAWPWNVPIGFLVAFTLGLVLARPRPKSDQRF
jgi:Na+/proline symporter